MNDQQIKLVYRLLFNHAEFVNHVFPGGLRPLPPPDEKVALDLRLDVLAMLFDAQIANQSSDTLPIVHTTTDSDGKTSTRYILVRKQQPLETKTYTSELDWGEKLIIGLTIITCVLALAWFLSNHQW